MYWLYDIIGIGIIALTMFLTIRDEYQKLRQENRYWRELARRQRATIYDLLDSEWQIKWI